MNLSSFDNLAAVRGLASVVVLLSHVIQVHFLRFTGLNTPLHLTSSTASKYAVVVFFILSGYLIAHTIEANIQRNGKLKLDSYFAARIARIYPPFLYCISVALAVFVIMGMFGLPGRSTPLSLPGDLYASRDFVHLSFREVISALFMLEGMLEINGPLWSLYIEVKLYVLFACALALMDRRGVVQKVILAALFYAVAKSGLALNPGFVGYAAVWLVGAIAYYVCNERGRRWNRLLLCGGLFVFLVLVEFYQAEQTDRSPWVVALEILIAASFAWLLFGLKLRISTPMAKQLAECSYSLYVTHFPILLLAQSLLIFINSTTVTAAVAVAVLSTATATGVAFVGGIIEAKKSVIQNKILALTRFNRKDVK